MGTRFNKFVWQAHFESPQMLLENHHHYEEVVPEERANDPYINVQVGQVNHVYDL